MVSQCSASGSPASAAGYGEDIVQIQQSLAADQRLGAIMAADYSCKSANMYVNAWAMLHP